LRSGSRRGITVPLGGSSRRGIAVPLGGRTGRGITGSARLLLILLARPIRTAVGLRGIPLLREGLLRLVATPEPKPTRPEYGIK